ncbi:MAG TPA: hypothetical protein VN613_05950, partial [Gemmatimonadaceae bacterium]|nr:hypothetical protein [Gemmatimonadaceae bacterium]
MTSSNLAFPAPAAGAARVSGAPSWSAIREWVLRAPLITKLLGANLVIAVVAAAVATAGRNAAAIGFIVGVLALSFAVNTVLVRLALSPLDDLQRVAERVSCGENYLRVPKSDIADRRIDRLGTTFNELLESVRSDHVHIHQLIRRGLAARETERAALSHELR